MIVIIIPAKGASRRLPNKNMALINGRPMIDYAIETAQASSKADAIYVTTDSDEIANHVSKQGVKVIRRSPTLGGETPIIEVYRHAVNEIGNQKIEIVIGLQVDHPDRVISVDEALRQFIEQGADHLISVQADGTKNGAHYILSRHFITTNESRKTVTIIDDCTNIHYPEDLATAASVLASFVSTST